MKENEVEDSWEILTKIKQPSHFHVMKYDSLSDKVITTQSFTTAVTSNNN